MPPRTGCRWKYQQANKFQKIKYIWFCSQKFKLKKIIFKWFCSLPRVENCRSFTGRKKRVFRKPRSWNKKNWSGEINQASCFPDSPPVMGYFERMQGTFKIWRSVAKLSQLISRWCQELLIRASAGWVGPSNSPVYPELWLILESLCWFPFARHRRRSIVTQS